LTNLGNQAQRVAALSLALVIAACVPRAATTRPPGGQNGLVTQQTATRPPPPATLTPTTIPIRGCISVGSLRVRRGPGTDHLVVGGVSGGDCLDFDAVDAAGEWIRVAGRTWAGDVSGWVFAGLVELSGDVGLLSTVRSLPTISLPQASGTATRQPAPTNPQPTAVDTRWPTATAGPSSGGGSGGGRCHPSYPTVCIPPSPPDLDCGDIQYRRFAVVGSDPHRFDGDHDGIGCES